MDSSIISNAFEHYPIIKSSDRYACYLYALIAKMVHDTPYNFQLSYYDALCSPVASQFISAVMLNVSKNHKFINLINLFTEPLCTYTCEEFISNFAPDLFAGDPKAVSDYLLSIQPSNTLHSKLLSAIKLQAILIMKQLFYHSSYPTLQKKLSALEDYKSILFRAYQESPYYNSTSQLLNFDEESLFNLWLLVNGIEYTPEPINIKRNVSAPLTKLLSANTDIEHILQLFFIAKTYSSLDQNSIDEPISYLRSVFLNNTPYSSTDYPSAGTALTVENSELGEAIGKWKDVDILDFHLALFFPASKNNLATENSIIYSQLHSLSRNGGNLLLIEPNPLFVDRIIGDCRISNDCITIAFLSPTLVQLYKAKYPDIQFSYFEPDSSSELTLWHCIKDPAHRGRDPRFIRQPNHDQYSQIYIFSRQIYESKILYAVKNIRFLPNVTVQTAIYFLVPQALIDHNADQFRNDFFCNNKVRWLLLFPQNTSSDWFKRNMLISFYPDNSNVTTIPVIRSSLFDTSPSSHPRICQDPWPVHVPVEHLCNNIKAIGYLWDYHRPKPRKNGQRSTHRYDFTQEITIWYSWSNRRGRYSFYKKPTQHQSKRNPLPRGKRLYGPIQFTAHSIDDAIVKIEEAIFQPELWKIIRDETISSYRYSPLSVKTFWFCKLDILCQDSRYNHNNAAILLSREHIAHCMLGNQLEFADYRHLFDLDFPEQDGKDSLPLWLQLNLILNLACKERILRANPISEFVNSLKERDKGYREARTALAKKSYTLPEEQKMLSFIYSKLPNDSRFVGAAISFYTGMSNTEICALSWGDFHQVKGLGIWQLWVYQTLDKSGTPRLIHTDELHSYRRVPCVYPLAKILLNRRNYLFKTYGYTSLAEMEKLPLVCESETDITAWCKPSSLKSAKDDMECAAGIEPISGIVTYDDDSKKATDFNDYHADRFRANIRYRSTQTCRMSKAELNYLLGLSMPTTFSKHYCDYTNDFAQLMLCRKLERWCATHIASPQPMKTTTLTSNTTTELKDGTRSCIELDILSSGVICDIQDNRGVSVTHTIVSEG